MTFFGEKVNDKQLFWRKAALFNRVLQILVFNTKKTIKRYQISLLAQTNSKRVTREEQYKDFGLRKFIL